MKRLGWLVGACYGKSQDQVGIQWILSQFCLNSVLSLKCEKGKFNYFAKKNNYKIWPTSFPDKE